MIFENRLAKIGKGFNVNLYVKNNSEISIFFYNETCFEKTLKITKEKFELVNENFTQSCDEIVKLSDNLYLYKKNNCIGLINNNV